MSRVRSPKTGIGFDAGRGKQGWRSVFTFFLSIPFKQVYPSSFMPERSMRRRLLITLVVLIGILPITGYSKTHEPPPPSETFYPYAVGLGAILGVVGTQAVLFGSAGFPFLESTVAPAATIAPEISVGVSRMFAVTSAVVGAWIANWLYDH